MNEPAVAVITDIHANLPALEAVLERIEELGIERVYCGGDLVGYGPHPNEVCALIEERGIPTIYGNYDYAIARDLEDCGCAYATQHERELGQRSVDWTLAHTDQRSKDFMRELPFDLRFERRRQHVSTSCTGRRARSTSTCSRTSRHRCTSASPRAEEADTLVFGHTHKPWMREYGGVLFVNCGSVGKPKDGDPRAAFAVLRLHGAGVDARIERVEYDAKAVAREVAAAGLPEEYAEKLTLAA